MPRGRSADYSKEELLHFLNIGLSIQPTSQTEWNSVLDEHNIEYAHKNRTVESLRRKYAQLHRKKIPTGDPYCPEEVRLAKRLRYKIGKKADMGDGEEVMNLFDGALGGGDDDDDDEDTDDSGNGSGNGNDNNIIVDIGVIQTLGNGAANGDGRSDGSNENSVTGHGNGGSAVASTTNGAALLPSVAGATTTINRSSGRSRLVVTPRNRSSSSEIGNAIQDLLQLQMVQMQQDRQLQMMRMEEERQLQTMRMNEERQNRQQLMDAMVAALGIFARNNQCGSNHPSGNPTNTNNNNSSS
jgi:hypothetical protein